MSEASSGCLGLRHGRGRAAHRAYGIRTLEPELLRADRMFGWPGPGKPLAPGPPNVPLTAVGVEAGA